MKHVEGHPDYVREPKLGAILLSNTSEVDKYKLIKKNKKDSLARIETLEKEVAELKKLVMQLLNTGNNKCQQPPI